MSRTVVNSATVAAGSMWQFRKKVLREHVCFVETQCDYREVSIIAVHPRSCLQHNPQGGRSAAGRRTLVDLGHTEGARLPIRHLSVLLVLS